MHTVVIVGGTAAEREVVVEAFGQAHILATAAEHLDPGARPHLLVITGSDAYALVREARSAPHLTDVPILVALPEVLESADSLDHDHGHGYGFDHRPDHSHDLDSDSGPALDHGHGHGHGNDPLLERSGRPPLMGPLGEHLLDHLLDPASAPYRIGRRSAVSVASATAAASSSDPAAAPDPAVQRMLDGSESVDRAFDAVIRAATVDTSEPIEVSDDAVEEILVEEPSGPMAVADKSGRMRAPQLAPLPAIARSSAPLRHSSSPLVAEPVGSTYVVGGLGHDDSEEMTGEHARARTATSTLSGRAYGNPMQLIDALLDAGASDVLRWPLPPRLLRNRAEMLLTVSRRVDLGPIPSELVRVNDVLTQHGDDADALVSVLEVLQEALQFERASLIAYIEGSDHGFVIAATDAPTRRQFTLAMAEYPEISHAMKSGAPVLIDDVLTHPLTMRLGAMLAERGVRGSAVLPVQWRGRLLGVILLRRSTPGVSHVAGRGIELAQLITSITAAHLRHGAVLASLREQTHRISRDRYEAERRLRGIDSLKEHFEAGTDGVVVLDNGGRVLFVNRAAERITGFARDGLIGSMLTELAPFEQRAQIEDAAAQVLAGTNVAPFDLSLDTTQHNPVRVSVSTSTVLAGTGAAIFSFRDVTAERKLENELRSTKEFLERLIDSTVDAIIAADLHGTIILFNQGAERLFGLRAEDMIGKRPVWDLYDKSAARQIMRMLRSNAYGGGGRLDATRREVKSRGGEQVPVSMTAAIIYEGGEEVATVGILTDLRERIRMEQRLAQAQRQLQLTEKQALVAELAGAAAHELNQPLTSILGYCELLKRQSPADATHMRAVGIISGQSERMAAIVKKIGRLTKYETTDYMGERILDLDRAADDSGLVVDPVEEGKTGEFTAVLPGGLAQVLGSGDFDLVWPGGVGSPLARSSDLMPVASGMTAGTRPERSRELAADEDPGEAVSDAVVAEEASVSLSYSLSTSLTKTMLRAIGGGDGAGDDDGESEQTSPGTSASGLPLGSPGGAAAGGPKRAPKDVSDDAPDDASAKLASGVASGSGPSRSPTDGGVSAVPSEISEGAATAARGSPLPIATNATPSPTSKAAPGAVAKAASLVSLSLSPAAMAALAAATAPAAPAAPAAAPANPALPSGAPDADLLVEETKPRGK